METAKHPFVIPFEFRGNGSEYFRIWWVNVLLSIITLGIYSAWAKVRRKQYFYGNTRLDGTGFEYLADPVKILKGRLIVGMFFVLYLILSNLIPRVATLLSLVFIVALPWLVLRSLSFNAYNSAFRNIRFGFRAGYGEAAKIFVLFPVAVVFTLGILGPFAFFRQKQFIVEHSSYGTTRFAFTASAGDYYRVFFSVFFPVLGGVVVCVLAGFIYPPIVPLIVLVLYLYLFAYVSVKITNLLFNSTQLSSHRFESALKAKEYMLIVLTNTIATALTLGFFHPWSTVRTLRYKADHLKLIPEGDLDHFIADRQEQVSAIGEEVSDFMEFDFGL